MKHCEKCGKRPGECVCKRPLQVGDRVRVYTENGHFTDTIGHLLPDDYVETGMGTYHAKQCRRLKPRAPKEPKPGRVERWMVFCVGDGFISAHLQKEAADFIAERKGGEVHRMTELRPGEVILDRAKLAAAWKNAQDTDPLFTRTTSHATLARALGIPEAP